MSRPTSSGEGGSPRRSTASTREIERENIEMRPSVTAHEAATQDIPPTGEQSVQESNVSSISEDKYSLQLSSRSRDQAPEAPATPSKPSHGILKKASTWTTTSRAEASAQPRSGPSSISPSPSVPRTRTRGYSLRRALFTQNIQQQSDTDGTVIEMYDSGEDGPDTKGSGVAANSKHGRKDKSVILEVPVEEDEELPPNPVRLSDPVYDLPLYRRWLSKQHTRSSPMNRFKKRFREARKKMLQASEIPPSMDGRHVTINASPSTANIDERTGRAYVDNRICSCRYTPLNFLPRQLYAQFGRLANFYFLCLSILQMIPGLSTTGTYTTIIPLLIFVSISMAKEGYDDLRRNRLDKEENERDATILDDELAPSAFDKAGETQGSVTDKQYGWKTIKWQDIRVGDVVLLKRNGPVPADLVLLHSDNPDGTTYIETKSLDGETNLKSKKAPAAVSELCRTMQDVRSLQAEFVAEDPNLDLYKFEGRVGVGDKVLPLTNNEIIYRGSILRNTSSAIGLVIYSGAECKIRMNATKNPRVKAPSMQAIVNKVVIIVAGLVFGLAIFMTVAYQIWRKDVEQYSWYLHQARVGFGPILTSFIIMFNTMLPLSLYVSLEIIKVSQMYLMNDVDMYDPDSDTPMEARTSTLNEELGQVSYIFSDKTGTLTNNSMRFRKMSVAGTAWLHDQDLQEEATQVGDKQKLRHKKRAVKGKGIASRKSRLNSMGAARKSGNSGTLAYASPHLGRPSMASTQWQPSTGPTDPLQCGRTEEMLEYIQRRPNTVFARKARFFILSLALCHTCVPEKDGEGNISFQAASPDELALVMAAQDLGYIVADRQSSSITVKTYPQGEDDVPFYETYEILDVIEFTSLRKRMSIIVRLPDQRICIFCKGADTTLRALLRLSDLASAQVDAIERRARQRKSMEAQEAIRRKSLHLNRKGSLPRSSMGGVVMSGLVRNSSVSLGRNLSMRDSVDNWLKDREADVSIPARRESVPHYTPRASVQLGSPRLSSHAPGRISMNITASPRSSFQTDENEDWIDETLAISDNAVLERCFQHVDDFATQGLRTLLYAYRYVTESDYRAWKDAYIEASTSLVDRQSKIEKVAELIETQLELVGATAIEDKLQEGVPDAIDRFRRAGIKLWMLTGDKRETAINIGHSCRLIKDYSTIIILDHESGELHTKMATAVANINDMKTAHSVLVVDGQTLALIEADSASKALFTDLAILADSVICCRASPSQKASLVRTIRLKVKGSVTLAIGDGANDIAMIQEAHLGIGIAGKEGLQAARSSDYSIAQFRFLLKLLLVHGRWNYIRICKYTLGTFWKEMMFYLVQALYQRWNGYTGTSLYEPWSLSMFNTLFTSLPVLFIGVFEKDLAASTLLAVPELYTIGQRNGGFSIKIYFWWALLATCDAMIIFFTMYSIYGEALFTRDNQLYAMGALAFSACVTLVSLKLQVLELYNKSIAAVIAIFLSVGGWWLWNLLLSLIYPYNAIYNVNHGLLDGFGKNLLWWLTLILIVLAVSSFEVTIRCLSTALFPTDVDTFQAYERDREVRKRFEEAASELLQQGWDRGTKRSSLELAAEEAAQAEREAQVQALLDRPRKMETKAALDPDSGLRRRYSAHSEDDADNTPPIESADADAPAAAASRKSVDVGDLFSKGFGSVRKGPDLR